MHTFKYNYKNLICEVRTTSGNALVANYYYDALGRRVVKAVNGGITQRFVYSSLETVATYDGSNNWKQNFIFSQRINSVLAIEQADTLDFDGDTNLSEITRSFYHTNAIGSTLEITAANQVVALSYRYDPYGTPTVTRGGVPQSGDPLGQSFAFAGALYDEEVSVYCMRFRTYDPLRGRFLQRDPLEYSEPNTYSYAGCSPVNYIDPLGLTKLRDLIWDYESLRETVEDCRKELGQAVDRLAAAEDAYDAAYLNFMALFMALAPAQACLRSLVAGRTAVDDALEAALAALAAAAATLEQAQEAADAAAAGYMQASDALAGVVASLNKLFDDGFFQHFERWRARPDLANTWGTPGGDLFRWKPSDDPSAPWEYFTSDGSGDLDYLSRLDPTSLEGYNAKDGVDVFFGVGDSGDYYIVHNENPILQVGRQWTDAYYYGDRRPTVSPGGSAIPALNTRARVEGIADKSRANRAMREMKGSRTYHKHYSNQGPGYSPGVAKPRLGPR
jgi:RHS repeat-associated protein